MKGIPSIGEYQSLSHTKWECKYHVVFIPKRRRKTLFGQVRQHLGEVSHNINGAEGKRLEERHLQATAGGAYCLAQVKLAGKFASPCPS
jgi:hypothetical protein